jgi:hypothetical protein
LAAVGAAVCLVGAYLVAAEQSYTAIPGESMWVSLWPLPGLVLAEWGLLGILGFVGILLGRPSTVTFAWGVCGALVALVVLGAFSIGPSALIALVFLTASALVASLRRTRNLLGDAGILMLGVLFNFSLFVILILVQKLS